jgi:3-oxoacyl-[acyl-carrier-protein] synthase-3
MRFISIQCNLGNKEVLIDSLSSTIDPVILKRIQEKSGITCLKICDENEDAISLAQALLASDVQKNNINSSDLIIVVSESKQSSIPPMSSQVLQNFDLSDTKLVLDLDSGCAGYVQALQVVDAFFQNPSYKNACIITTDAYSKYIDYADRTVAPIFGDGASITFLENDGIKSIKTFNNGSDMTKSGCLEIKGSSGGNLKMNGGDIFMFVKKNVPKSIKVNLDKDDVDYFFIHQASKVVLEEIRKDLNISESKAPFRVAETGNLVSTSIPFLLQQIEGKLEQKKIILTGFGVGLTWATTLMEL